MEEITYITVKNTVPSGIHNALCVGVYDLFLQAGYQGGEPQRKMMLVFEIDKLREGGDFDGKPYRLSKRMTVSLHEKSTLAKTLKVWFGADPSNISGGQKQFNPSTLIGKACSLAVSQYDSNGETKSKIDSILPHDSTKPTLTTEFDASVTPEWIQSIQAQRLDKPSNTNVVPEISPPQEDRAKPGDADWMDD